MDNFFYNLNDKLNAIRATPETQLNESAVAEASYSAKAARAGKDIGKPGKNFEKIAKSAGERYGSKAAGERVAGAVLNKLRHPKEGMDEAVRGLHYGDQGWQAPANQAQRDAVAQNVKQKRAINRADTRVTGYGNRVEPQRGPESGTGAAGATVQRTQPSYGGQETPVNFKPSGDYVNPKHIDRGGNLQIKPGQGKGVAEEGGLPMTAKQKSFAALAPPKDKITFADKIAGAKKEVDEMLGDVAAEAMKNALSGRKQMADEGWDDMVGDVKKRMGPKVGDVKRGARHDIETTATGIRATRRHDDEEDEQPTGEKRRAGRPKGADKGPERVTAKAYKHKGGRIKEEGIMPGATDADAGEYGYEGDMAKDQIHTIVRHAKALEKILSNREDLPEWVQSKLAKIEGMMAAVDDYMETQHERGAEMDQGIDLEEESTDTRDNRAEKAGKKVTKDLEYDMKHKGKDDAKAERAGKKVTKDIEYDEKKKEKKVAETTSSGSVATGGDAVKSTKGGVQIGKGIYDSLNRELENMISESMSINVSMTNDDNGSHKNITVTAADEDAEILAQLLQRAGLGGGMSHDHSHEEPCPDCGSTDCGCDESMAEAYGDTDASQNKPNWPTDTEYNDDAFQYSGGLNKPKASGMATIPVTDVQTDGEDKFGSIDRLREMAGIKQQELMPWERTMKEEAVEEGVVDTVKDVVKKGIDALKGPDDDKLLSKLEKETGGKRPEKKDEKMQESLMREFANFKI